MSPLREGGGPNPPYHESFLENIVGVSWGRLFFGTYIVVLGTENDYTASVIATSNHGIKWNFWPVLTKNRIRPILWTISGGPGPGDSFILQAAGAYSGSDADHAVLFHSTNDGVKWYDNTPKVLGDVGKDSQIDGGGYSYMAKAPIATTWAWSPNTGVLNSILMLHNGKWKMLASGPDPSGGDRYEFPGGIIPPDSITYNTSGGGFDEFPPIYYDPVSTTCPYIGPDGFEGFYQGRNTAAGPPGILNGYNDFVMTTFQNGNYADVPVKQLNDTKLVCHDMFFASNFSLGTPDLKS
jgi:hypothetical protein